MKTVKDKFLWMKLAWNHSIFSGRNEQQKASKGNVLGHVVQIDMGRFRFVIVYLTRRTADDTNWSRPSYSTIAIPHCIL